MRKKKNYRFIFDALLIFLSVLGAVWAENYREFLNQKHDYIGNLLILRNEIHLNIGNFRSSYDSIVLRNRKVDRLPYLIEQDTTIQFLMSKLSNKEGTIDVQAIRVAMTMSEWVDWRNNSSVVNWIRSSPEFLIDDSLYQVVDSYERLMSYEFVYYGQWNETTKKVREAIMQEYDINDLALESPTVVTPTKSLLRKLRNLMYDLHEINDHLMATDSLFAKQLSQELIRIDSRLSKHGIDTKSLASNNLVND